MCFKEALFPLLARMRHGLYYNTFLTPGCVGSGLMQAFSKHLLTRLDVHQEPSVPNRVRVTLLSRSTKHRRIINEEEVRACVCAA
jgi:protein O-GlcNAc transferase